MESVKGSRSIVAAKEFDPGYGHEFNVSVNAGDVFRIFDNMFADNLNFGVLEF